MAEKDETKEELKAGPKAKSPVLCGHENKHYIPPKDLKDARLFCTLPKDHTGDHQSKYQVLRDEKLVDSVAYWNDAAGTEVGKE